MTTPPTTTSNPSERVTTISLLVNTHRPKSSLFRPQWSWIFVELFPDDRNSFVVLPHNAKRNQMIGAAVQNGSQHIGGINNGGHFRSVIETVESIAVEVLFEERRSAGEICRWKQIC